MTTIKPFQAVIYNPQKVNGLSKVICPPYDVISPAAQERYHGLSPYNLIHVLLGKDPSLSGGDKYLRAAACFNDWLKSGVLIQDASPAIYFYSHQYNLKGETRTRLGFVALLRLQEDNQSVFGHEHTRLEPKEDRLRLLRAVKANLSPIFVLFSDKKRIIQRIYQQRIQSEKPFIDVSDEERAVHKIWRLDEPAVLEKVSQDMRNEKIFIADGHHRYEVACAYRDEMRLASAGPGSDEDFNYVMAYFTNVDSRGLTVLPIHRFAKLSHKAFDIDSLLVSLREYFDVEEVKDRVRFFFLMEKAGSAEHVLGMYKDGRHWLLRLKNVKILDKEIPDKCRDYRTLDVSILNYLVLKKSLKIDADDKQRVCFSPHAQELIGAADNDGSAIAFFLNPVKMHQITSVALCGEKMPSKSTYFYPKVLSGLLINKLKGTA